MTNICIVGATRGLGQELVKKYSLQQRDQVYATARNDPPAQSRPNIHWIGGIDLSTEEAGRRLASLYGSDDPIDILIVTAGYFGAEKTLDDLDWEKQLTMYKTSAMGPVFLIKHLIDADLLGKGSKVILVSSESGSIALRHEKEGGGNYGHHASKAAENMVGKLLSLDLKQRGVAVALVHPGFMRTEMTKGVGFDEFWDEGGAVTPEEAAGSLIEWIEGFDIKRTGTYWAPRGAADIGTAEAVLGDKSKLPVPLELPW